MFLVIILYLFSLRSPLHPIHISVSDVEINDVEIIWIARIYKDDLLLGLYGPDTKLSRLEKEEEVRKDILKYVSKQVSVKIEGKNVSWSLTDLQPDPEAIYVTMSAQLPHGNHREIAIQNNILFNVYCDQKNIVNLTWNTLKKNMVFEPGDGPKQIEQ